MQARLPVFGLALLMSLSQSATALADTNPPLDLIELLGEMDDEDTMLEIALAELVQKTGTTPRQDHNARQKKNSEIAVPAGGSTK